MIDQNPIDLDEPGTEELRVFRFKYVRGKGSTVHLKACRMATGDLGRRGVASSEVESAIKIFRQRAALYLTKQSMDSREAYRRSGRIRTFRFTDMVTLCLQCHPAGRATDRLRAAAERLINTREWGEEIPAELAALTDEMALHIREREHEILNGG